MYRELNKFIIKERYQIPTLEELNPKLDNRKMYTLLDLKDGFHQCELEDSSNNFIIFQHRLVHINF